MRGRATQIQLKGHSDIRGTISVLEMTAGAGNAPALPFAPKRIYILHGQDKTQHRGAHAHKALLQVIIAMVGTVKIEVDNGVDREVFYLSGPHEALLLEPVLWRDIELTAGAVVAVLASEVYDESDYIREYGTFLTYMGQTTP